MQALRWNKDVGQNSIAEKETSNRNKCWQY